MRAFGCTRILRAAALATIVGHATPAAAQSLLLDTEERPPIGDSKLVSLGARIIAAEGGPGRNPLSSASGYGQFLAGTWLEMFERAYPQIAQTMTQEQILALRDIKPLAEDLTNRYAQANAASLRRVGLPATAAELYLAHAIGPGGAVSVLTAGPARPATELLRPEAISANPFLKEMTAGTLRQWATFRVDTQDRQPPADGLPKTEPWFEPLNQREDFRIDDRTKASQALVTNHDVSTVLADLLDALSKPGVEKDISLRPSTSAWLRSVGVEPIALARNDPIAIRIFNKTASRAVLDAIHSVADRPNFAEFKAIARHATTKELPREVIRAVAIALLDKMHRENATITSIVRHRRGGGAAQQSSEHVESAPQYAHPALSTAADPPL